MTPVFEFAARLQVQADSKSHACHRAEALADAVAHGEADLFIESFKPLPDGGTTPPDSGTASPCVVSAIARRPGGPEPRR
jgi:hypothetical protein